MIKKLVVTAVSVGAAAALAIAAPSYAAAAPTLTGPALRVGYGPVELSGTAAPGATVQLYETAIVFDDLEPADDWANGGGPLIATADSGGHWRLQRILDSGFYFQVVSDGVRSNKLTVRIQQDPVLTLSSSSANTVDARVEASPGQPTLTAQVQVNLSGSTWTTIANGETGDGGVFTATAGNVPGGTHAFRAYVGADPSNGVLAGYSAGRNLTVLGTPANPPPAPSGGVEFTKVQYRAKSLNGEWVLVTNHSGATVDLRGWTIRDAAGHVYTFSSTFRLRRGGAAYVHTGKGTNSVAHRYWGRTGYIWNDGGDTAVLRNSQGATVDACKWGAGSGVATC
jgi:hypothetical protein